MRHSTDVEKGDDDDISTVYVPATSRQEKAKEERAKQEKAKSIESSPAKSRKESQRKSGERLWERLGKESSSRFDQILGTGVKEPLKPSQKSFSREFQTTKIVPTKEEIDDFFLNNSTEGESKLLIDDRGRWSSSAEDEKGSTKQDQDGEDDEEETSELSLLKAKKDAVTIIAQPAYIPFHVRVAAALKNLFFPSATQEIMKEKFAEGGFRKFEEEGIFKGQKPLIRRSNLRIIENRLLKQGNSHWFNEAGEVEREDFPFTNPLAIRSFEDENDNPLYTFVPACSAEDFKKEQNKRIHLNEQKGILRISLESIRFTNHPHFTAEHRLASQLKIKYEFFIERKNLRVAQISLEKLKILRQSLSKLQQLDPQPTHERGRMAVRSEIDKNRRHVLYRREIKECRQQWIDEAMIDRNLITEILHLWSEIKEDRKSNGFQTTDLNLVIRRQKVKSKKAEERKWKKDFQEEVEERYEEEREEWMKKDEKYKVELKEWRQKRGIRKEATKRQKKLRNKNIEDLQEEEVLQMAQDQITLSLPELTKPEPPKKVEKDEVKQKVEENFSKVRRSPGEPIIDFELQTTSSITPTKECPSKERQRRNVVSRLKVWIKILINNKLVTLTTPVKMPDDFFITVSTSLLAAVLSWPDAVKLEIYEGSPLKQKLLSTLHLPLPYINCIENAGVSSSDVAQFGSLEGGSIERVKGKEKERYGGNLLYRLTWKKGEDGMPLLPKGKPPKRNLIPKLSKQSPMYETLRDSNLDPNDPRNAEVLTKMKATSIGLESQPVFDLHGEEDAFCSAEEIQTNVRFRVLKLRNDGVPEFKGLERIPPIESQVLYKPLEKYEKNFESIKRKKVHDKESSKFGENTRKLQAEELVESIIRRLELQSSQAAPTLTLQDLVQEEQIPQIGSIGELVTGLKPRRPLRPSRKKRGQVKGIGLTDQNVNLIIHISRGFYLPMRKEFADMMDERASTSTTDSISADSFDSMVRPFVEVSFQRNIERTHTSHGSNPTWNQQIVLPFKAPNNNFTASSLQTVSDSVFFHLYDEVIYDLLNDERQRGNTIHQQIEKRWLGSLKIPFSTIYLQNKIEGTFRLESPPILLGYMSEFATEQIKSKHEDDSSAPHLSVYLTVEPTLPPSKPLKETFESTEPADVIREGKSYASGLTNRFPQRHFRSHVLDFFGKLVCLTRFIKPLAPPLEILGENGNHEIERICWYVSLIPSLASISKIPGMPTVWANVEQHISLGIGNADEKAILLTNYLLHLGYEAYLLVGSGIPDGITCFVLAKVENAWKIFCPSSAINYDVYKPNCPLKAIYMLISEQNIYSNVQKYEDPPRLNFNTKISTAWKPIFGASFPNPNMPTVQPESFTYKPVDETKWKELKEKLQVILRDAIMKWRPTQRTPWNRFASNTQRKLLRSYEESSLNGKVLNPENKELTAMMQAYKVCGVCIHQEYTTIASVVEAVYSTGIHSMQIPGSEFALAIEIVPYPGGAASVWVYIASLQKRI